MVSLADQEWWWALDPPQEALREVLEKEGFPPFTVYSRRPDFGHEDVDMDRVKEIALRLRYGTYEPKHEKKAPRPRKKRSKKNE